jgi:uncharacterized repeat protein (TIGR03843 family)
MGPGDPDAPDFLRNGRIEVQGRLVDASNATLYCAIALEGVEAACVYKPISGERPLWDFPDGTLAAREVATYLISEAAGLTLVPPTVMRPGPFGPGMVQLWIDTKEGDDLVDVLAPAEVPPDWRVVLHAHDRHGDPAVLAHANHPHMRLLAALDVILNNADRKGGHVLHGTDGHIYGVDHGICLHQEPKLRTILWGWQGEPLDPETLGPLRTLRGALDGPLTARLAEHLTRAEIRALTARADSVLADPYYPHPSTEGRAIPWPAF